jgi:shikimate dehydrogenase
VYAPVETPFLREVERAGGRTASGLTMLVYQGAEGFELCTGKKAPVQVMMDAVKKAKGIK